MTDLLPSQIPDDPRGWLTFSAPLPNDLQRAEDSTQHHDFYGGQQWSSGWDENASAFVSFFTRSATDTEKTLLTALGYEIPDDLQTRVSFPSPLVRRRRWPSLETEGNTP